MVFDDRVLGFIRDDLTGQLSPKKISTKMIQKSENYNSLSNGVPLQIGTAGWVPSGTAPLKLTMVNVVTKFSGKKIFAFADRSGTFAFFPNVQDGDEEGFMPKVASVENPLFVVYGTMNVYPMFDSSDYVGTVAISWAGVQ